MKYIILIFIMTFSLQIIGQATINFNDENARNRLYIKLYGELDYNQKIEKGKRHSGVMDVHRLVTLFGFQFNRNTQFVTEIEMEHVKELFVEQAFVKHRLTKGINLRAGLLLIPMGMVNEYHEPTFFYSVERPLLDLNIIPTTWRELGFGISGLFPQKSLKYQLYLVNGPLGFDGESNINAAKGIRSARQKGAQSIINSFPNISGQLEYFGFNGGKVGLSVYHGKTNTTEYDLFEDASSNELTIDSSRVTMSMMSLHSSFDIGNWTTRLQYTMANYGENDAFNRYTGSDVPNMMHGFYVVLAYDFLKNDQTSLSPFIRFSHLNNQLSIDEGQEINQALKQNIITFGLNYKPNPGVVFKMDYQLYRREDNNNFQMFNTGVGVWF